MEFSCTEIQGHQVKSEDLSHIPQANVGDDTRDGFMQNQLIFSDPVISHVEKKSPEPVEHLERQAFSGAKFFEDMHSARWDIPVLQRAVDDTQSKEGWRGFLSGCRYQHQRTYPGTTVIILG